MNKNLNTDWLFLTKEAAKNHDADNTTSTSKKHKHSSALVAASRARSAVEHVDPHRLSSLSSNFKTTGTNVSYEE
jgi:hypothetical protein